MISSWNLLVGCLAPPSLGTCNGRGARCWGRQVAQEALVDRSKPAPEPESHYSSPPELSNSVFLQGHLLQEAICHSLTNSLIEQVSVGYLLCTRHLLRRIFPFWCGSDPHPQPSFPPEELILPSGWYVHAWPTSLLIEA